MGEAAVGVTLLVALIGVETALITTVVNNKREREWRDREREERRVERLRSLYSDVMLAAPRLMPDEFHARLGSGAGATTRDEIDMLGARLRLERWEEGNYILEQLQDVWHVSNDWNEHRNEPERAMNLVDPLRLRMVGSLQTLEDEMRRNLSVRRSSRGATLRRRE